MGDILVLLVHDIWHGGKGVKMTRTGMDFNRWGSESLLSIVVIAEWYVPQAHILLLRLPTKMSSAESQYKESSSSSVIPPPSGLVSTGQKLVYCFAWHLHCVLEWLYGQNCTRMEDNEVVEKWSRCFLSELVSHGTVDSIHHFTSSIFAVPDLLKSCSTILMDSLIKFPSTAPMRPLLIFP